MFKDFRRRGRRGEEVLLFVKRLDMFKRRKGRRWENKLNVFVE